MQVMTRCGPAILGGPKAVRDPDPQAYRWPILTDEDRAAIEDVLRDGDLSLHPVAEALEADYRAYFGRAHALAHCNGTMAMLAAFFATGLKPGDEVLVPSATHWASVVPMLWLGAVPVFCESEGERLGLDPEDVSVRITPRSRAMVVVHLWGMPARMRGLLDVARRNGLKVIEDASHAHGAIWRDRKCGTLGDIGVFSLQSGKLAPAGEGGMFLTDSAELHERAVCLGDVERILRLPGATRRFAGTSFGLKTRIASLSAAVARVQFRHLDARNEERNANQAYLSERLEPLGFDTFQAPGHIRRVYFEFIIRARFGRIRADDLVAALRAEGCEVSCPRYPLLHQQPLFTEGAHSEIPATIASGAARETPCALPRTEALNRDLIRLPSFPRAPKHLLDAYAEAFEKVVEYCSPKP